MILPVVETIPIRGEFFEDGIGISIGRAVESSVNYATPNLENINNISDVINSLEIRVQGDE